MQIRLNQIAVHEISLISEKLFAAMAYLLLSPMQAWIPLSSQYHHNMSLVLRYPLIPATIPTWMSLRTAMLVSRRPSFTRLSPPYFPTTYLLRPPSLQMLMNLTESVSPKAEVDIEAKEDERIDITDELVSPVLSQPSGLLSPPQLSTNASDSPVAALGVDSYKTPEIVMEGMGVVRQADVVEDDLEFVGVLPTEEIETAQASAVVLTESDVGRESCHVVSSTLIEGSKVRGSLSLPLKP